MEGPVDSGEGRGREEKGEVGRVEKTPGGGDRAKEGKAGGIIFIMDRPSFHYLSL